MSADTLVTAMGPAVGAGAGSSIGPSVGAGGRAVGFGVLGCADIARRRMIPALRASPKTRLVAVASRTMAKAEAFAVEFGATPVHGYQPLLEREDVEAVYVPLPPGLHADWIGRALRAGKHVLAEKPLTTSYARTADLVGLARSSNLVLMENFSFLHHSRHERVRKLLSDGVIGELRMFSGCFTIPARPAGDIRNSASLGGGALLDIGCYPVRAAQLFLGPELEVTAAVLRMDGDLGVDTGGSAVLHRADGVITQLTFGMDHWYVSEYHLLGSTGRICVQRAFTPSATLQTCIRIDRRDHSEQVVLPLEDQWAGLVSAFAAAVRAGDITSSSAPMLRQAALLDEVGGAAIRPRGRGGRR